MKLFSYEMAKQDGKTLKSLTSLTVREFEALCRVFAEVWNEECPSPDERKGGRPPILKTMEDRLFFILFYLKTYPLQEVLAFSFEMSQGEAHRLIHLLSEVLKKALQRGGFTPPRLPDAVLSRLEAEAAQAVAIDGTERSIVRPSNEDVQATFYSGKKHRHTVKNNVLVGLDDRQIKGLSDTHEGKKHDKKIADENPLPWPPGCEGSVDAGFQGYQPPGVTVHHPQKKPRGGPLTEEAQAENGLIASLRVVVEHVIAGIKRCHIVKETFRNTRVEYDDTVMELACGLHNLRSQYRQEAY